MNTTYTGTAYLLGFALNILLVYLDLHLSGDQLGRSDMAGNSTFRNVQRLVLGLVPCNRLDPKPHTVPDCGLQSFLQI
jgi:hypothetical protein